MLEQLHEHVFLLVQSAVAVAATAAGGSSDAGSRALQYVVCNVGQRAVSVRADWGASEHVAVNGQTTEMVVNTVVHPMQRREIACVQFMRSSNATKRGFVRVSYAVHVLDDEVASVPASEHGGSVSLDQVDEVSLSVLNTFAPMLKSHRDISATAASTTRQQRREIDSFGACQAFRDPTFPPTVQSLAADNKPLGILTSWRHLGDVLDTSWVVHCGTHKRETSESDMDVVWSCGLTGQESLLCALAALHGTAAKTYVLSQWSKTDSFFRGSDGNAPFVKFSRGRSIVAVPLWPQGRLRRDVLVDLFTPTTANGHGQLSVWSSAGEAYTLLLHKALAKWHGSYAALAVVPTRQLLLEITGLALEDVSIPCGASQVDTTQLRQFVHRLCDNNNNLCVPMASFRRVDGHHCAFRVLGATADYVELLDSNRILAYGMKTLGLHQHEYTEGRSSALRLPWTQFFAIEPQVFEIRIDRRHQQRLRRVFYPTSHSTTMRAVLSVVVSTTISLTVSCSRIRDCTTDDEYVLKVAVDRVDDHDLTLRLPWTTTSLPSSSDSNHSVSFPVSSGEYIIRAEISMKRQQPQSTEESVQRCSEQRSLSDNVDMLFACLDHDADGLLGRREISHFLRCCEAEFTPVDDTVDNFLIKFGSFDKSNNDSALALTRDDLRQVYQSMAGSEQLHGVKELVQRDLCRVLALDDEGSDTFRYDELLEVVWVLSSASKGCQLVPIV